MLAGENIEDHVPKLELTYHLFALLIGQLVDSSLQLSRDQRRQTDKYAGGLSGWLSRE